MTRRFPTCRIDSLPLLPILDYWPDVLLCITTLLAKVWCARGDDHVVCKDATPSLSDHKAVDAGVSMLSLPHRGTMLTTAKKIRFLF